MQAAIARCLAVERPYGAFCIYKNVVAGIHGNRQPLTLDQHIEQRWNVIALTLLNALHPLWFNISVQESSVSHFQNTFAAM